MNNDEQELFSLIDDARVQRGCDPLGRDSGLTGAARGEAGDRATSGDVSATGSSSAATGSSSMSAKDAFNRLKDQSFNIVFNCGLHELGVGRATAEHKSGGLLCGLGLCRKKTRIAWVVDFN